MNWLNMNSSLQGVKSTNTYINQAYGTVLGTGTSVLGTSFENVLNTFAQKVNVSDSFITPMDDIFEEASKAYGVDVNLLKAIAKAESNFQTDVTSSAGAMGVMQLMPSTAQSLGVTDPYDARQNIMGGAKYIADKLNAYDGDVTLALAAYNAGSGNVEKYGGVPPFSETQNYIQKIMEYMGQNLSAGVLVQSGSTSGVQTSLMNTESGISTTLADTSFNTESLNYLVDMMRVQMDMKLSQVVSDLFDEESSEQVL